MQFNEDGRERVVSYQSRQMKPTERNYPVHDKELLAMRYALIKFRVYLLGELTFAVYVDHASLRTAMKSPSLEDPDDAAQRGVSPRVLDSSESGQSRRRVRSPHASELRAKINGATC
ncbi:hypothetical protein PI125_g16082 [Phytophthora idaei]|nr:hypothetical protein PI125_g16082 [Phytophthora idaei]